MSKQIDDLRDILFAQMERLNNPDLTGENLQQELERANGIQALAGRLVESAKVEVLFMKEVGGNGTGFIPHQKHIPPPSGDYSNDGHQKVKRKYS